MSKFRKKPVVIEAFQYLNHGTPQDSWPSWFQDAWQRPNNEKGAAYVWRDPDLGRLRTFIHTLEGEHEVTLGDWIVRGVMGEIYPVKPDIFAATYEPMREGS